MNSMYKKARPVTFKDMLSRCEAGEYFAECRGPCEIGRLRLRKADWQLARMSGTVSCVSYIEGGR